MNNEVEELARKLHENYLIAVAWLKRDGDKGDTGNFNPNAVKQFDDLTEEQKHLDRHIAKLLLEEGYTKQPTNLVGLDIGKLLTFAREYWKDKPLLTEGDSFGDNDFVRFLDLICSRFGQRTVELLSVEEIYAIINSYKMFDKFTVNGISQRIHSAMQEKIGEKK